MSYPPGSPGYPPAQQPTTQFSAPTQQLGKLPEPAAPAAAEGPSKLPVYLTAAVAALGLAVYLSNYGPLFEAAGGEFFTPTLLDLGVVASLLGALIAGVGLIPKQKTSPSLVAVLSVLGFLLVVSIVLTAPQGVTIEWGLYLIIAFSVVQAIVAVAVLLFDADVITPPVPKPRYEPQQYGQYGGPGQYYGQPHQPGPPHQQQQRPGYPSQYGGGYPGGPSTGGFSGGPQQPQQQGGPPTPPTGFPAYGQPPSSNASNSSSAPTTQVPAQPSPSTQSGPPPS
ncbi:MAG TPA: DUF5336 domain-containing protein [Mycobacterium sp.]